MPVGQLSASIASHMQWTPSVKLGVIGDYPKVVNTARDIVVSTLKLSKYETKWSQCSLSSVEKAEDFVKNMYRTSYNDMARNREAQGTATGADCDLWIWDVKTDEEEIGGVWHQPVMS